MNKFSLSNKEVPRKNVKNNVTKLAPSPQSSSPRGLRIRGWDQTYLQSKSHDLPIKQPHWHMHMCHGQTLHYWLVVWNMNFIVPYIGNNHPNWRSHIFQRGRYTTNVIILPVLGGWEEIVNQSIHSFPIPWDGWPWDGWPQSCILYWQL